jgi:hypothetical protein
MPAHVRVTVLDAKHLPEGDKAAAETYCFSQIGDLKHRTSILSMFPPTASTVHVLVSRVCTCLDDKVASVLFPGSSMHRFCPAESSSEMAFQQGFECLLDNRDELVVAGKYLLPRA